jgi:hypothetical protein
MKEKYTHICHMLNVAREAYHSTETHLLSENVQVYRLNKITELQLEKKRLETKINTANTADALLEIGVSFSIKNGNIYV